MYDAGGINLKPAGDVTREEDGDVGRGSRACGDVGADGFGLPHDRDRLSHVHRQHASGSAMKVGDVLTIRGGATVEINDTAAAGRLVMADASPGSRPRSAWTRSWTWRR